jgi:hypothetical protein
VSSYSVKHLFPQLLINGYIPIPNRDKVCMLPKWSTILVDERQCKLWTRQSRWPAIGLRVEPPLLVLDNDLPHPDIAKAVRGIMPAKARAGLERLGSPPKTAFFLRLKEGEEVFREAHTRRYRLDGAAFAVQAFAGGGGAAQFGAFGPHSHDEHGAVLKTYSWVRDRSPANVPIWKLPELTRAEVFAYLDVVDALLADWPGMVVDTLTKLGEAYQAQAYDLTNDMVFVDAEGSEYTLEELTDEARARKELKQGQLRLTGSFTGDTSSSGSPRCKVYWSVRYGLSIVDFKTGTTHRPAVGENDAEMQRILEKILPKGVGREGRC